MLQDWISLKDATIRRFGIHKDEIIQGLLTCAILTFVSMSYSSQPCTDRTHTSIPCASFAEPAQSNNLFNQSRKALNKHVVHVLSQHEHTSSKTWEKTC